jgi:hypothetical protein
MNFPYFKTSSNTINSIKAISNYVYVVNTNMNLLFFNIEVEDRFCHHQYTHDQRNITAILIDIKHYIQCPL